MICSPFSLGHPTSSGGTRPACTDRADHAQQFSPMVAHLEQRYPHVPPGHEGSNRQTRFSRFAVPSLPVIELCHPVTTRSLWTTHELTVSGSPEHALPRSPWSTVGDPPSADPGVCHHPPTPTDRPDRLALSVTASACVRRGCAGWCGLAFPPVPLPCGTPGRCLSARSGARLVWSGVCSFV